MSFNPKATVAVVTGAGRGIGESLARALAARGARALAVCDIDADAAQRIATDIAATNDGVLAPADIAEHTLDAMANGQFMIRPHPKVAGYVLARADDTERWIAGMRKLRARQLAKTGRPV